MSTARSGSGLRPTPPPSTSLPGSELADSWAVDAHKWLNVSYDSGIALVRNPEHLRAAVRLEAPYLVSSGSRDPMHHTPQSSQRARGVEIWAVLASLGRVGARRPDREELSDGTPARRRARGGGLPGPQRRRAQPGRGRLSAMQPTRSSTRSRRTAPAGPGRRPGRASARSASASATGRPPRTTSIEARLRHRRRRAARPLGSG